MADEQAPGPVTPAWDERGLVPCVVQDDATAQVLMLAWMNAEALELTRTTGVVHFWSRSRQALWKKGESSGNVLTVRSLAIDCDADAILVRATPAGPTCHTGATSCWFRSLDGEPAPAGLDAAAVLGALEATMIARRDAATAQKSYTKSLLDGGAPKISSKITEEAGELVEELLRAEPDDDDLVYEAADLMFHAMVGLVSRRVPMQRVWAELARRFGTSGHAEKASRSS